MKVFEYLAHKLAEELAKHTDALRLQAMQAPLGPEENGSVGMELVPSNFRTLGLIDNTTPRSDQQRQAYRGVLWRCLEIRSDALALAMRGFSVERRIDFTTYEEVESGHPWMTLLTNPCPNVPAAEFYKWCALARDITGSADLAIQRDQRGVPVALYPIYPAFGILIMNADSTGGIERYTLLRSDGVRLGFDAEDIIRIRRGSPINPYESASLIQAAAYQVDIDLYNAIYRRDSMERGGIRATVLATEQDLTKAQMDKYGKEFKSRYVGGRSVGEVAVMGSGLKPVTFAHSTRDMEFVQVAQLNTTELLTITGVMEGMISDKSNRANAKESRLTFYQNTVQPEAELIASQFTHAFERSFGAERGALLVRVPDLIPLDHEFELKRREAYIQNGLRTINELRTDDGYDPLEGGDKVLVAGSLRTLESIINGSGEGDGGDGVTGGDESETVQDATAPQGATPAKE